MKKICLLLFALFVLCSFTALATAEELKNEMRLWETGTVVIWIGSVLSATIAIYRLVTKPIKRFQHALSVRFDGLTAGVGSVDKKVDVVLGDIGDVLCDRLHQSHDFYMRQKWCPKADKMRLVSMQKRYLELGRNHMTKQFELDLLGLPNEKKVTCDCDGCV